MFLIETTYSKDTHTHTVDIWELSENINSEGLTPRYTQTK